MRCLLATRTSNRRALWHGALVVALSAFAGCSQNSYALQGQLQGFQQQQSQLAMQNQQLQTRANTLDQSNQELETLLAQSKQQAQRLEEHLSLLRDQLRGATTQIAQLMDEKRAVEQQAQTRVASTRRPSAEITANTSVTADVSSLQVPGVEARQDGDVVRIELAVDRLFEPGTARLLPNAAAVIDPIADEIRRSYPQQKIGVEGHTDSDPARPALATSQHQLSIQQASAVMDHLTARSRFPAEQLLVVGHGGNHPVVSNATQAGRARNRRVELVIYPER